MSATFARAYRFIWTIRRLSQRPRALIMGALHIDSAACNYKGSLIKTTGGQWTCTGEDVEAILLDQIAGNINVATRNQWGANQ